VACLAALLAAAPVAQELPDLGGSERSVLSQQTERKIGEAIYRDVQRDPEFLDDAEVNEYLNLLGAKLVAAGPGSPWDYVFFAMRDATINAFALPGGYVGVNTGLIRLTENESELASVLAHEVSHVTQRHIARMIGGQQKAQIPAMIGLAAAILLANSRPDLATAAAAASQAGVMQYQLNYTRDFEREADRVGFQRLTAAGFDASAMGVFFEKLQRSTRVADDGSVPGYLRSHPVTTERIAEAQSRAAGTQYRQSLDSPDYQLVRAKLRVDASDARDAVAFYSDALRDRRYASEAATRYGLALARLKAGQKDLAAQEMPKLRATGVAGSMIESLAARIQDARGERKAAIATLRAATTRFPSRRAVLYDYLKLLLDDRQHDVAGAELAERLRGAPRDAKLHAFQARVYQAQGRNLLHHQAQAEAYYLEGALPAAIEQLEIALKAGDGDFYQLSAAEARLKLLRAEREQEARQGKRP
jgi:predicted Zn-dependent protease